MREELGAMASARAQRHAVGIRTTGACEQPVTPAMAASLTDHVWTTTELLAYRVPRHFLDKGPELERLYPPFEETHDGS
jgi:hypothetical protein